MGRHRRPGWFGWLAVFRREQARNRVESAEAMMGAHAALKDAAYQDRRSVDFLNELNRFLERHT